jgi:hypothetical protein
MPIVVAGNRGCLLVISAIASWPAASEIVGMRELSRETQPDIIGRLMICRSHSSAGICRVAAKGFLLAC